MYDTYHSTRLLLLNANLLLVNAASCCWQHGAAASATAAAAAAAAAAPPAPAPTGVDSIGEEHLLSLFFGHDATLHHRRQRLRVILHAEGLERTKK